MALDSDSAKELRASLAAACTRHMGDAGAVENLRRLTGGASQETWSFDFVTAEASRLPLILRRKTLAIVASVNFLAKLAYDAV